MGSTTSSSSASAATGTTRTDAMLTGRRLTLLEAAQSEARRFGQATPGALHLALTLGRSPDSLAQLDAAFGADARRRIIARLGQPGVPDSPTAEALLALA